MSIQRMGMWIVGAVIVAGAGYYAVSTAGEQGAMMEKDSMQGEVMNKPEGDSTMETDAMMKDEGEGAMMKDEGAMMEGEAAMMRKGSYEPYAPEKLANAESGDVVLFFRASWCPTCKLLDADIRSNLSAIPESLTILDVNYDASAALKQKYGVTYQHTLVQVRSDGSMVKKWSGSPTLATLAAQVQ